MAVGLEVRVPFCDHRLVEYVFNIPWHLKRFDGREKSILRAATRELLPDSIVEREKNPIPLRKIRPTRKPFAPTSPRFLRTDPIPQHLCSTGRCSRICWHDRWEIPARSPTVPASSVRARSAPG